MRVPAGRVHLVAPFGKGSSGRMPELPFGLNRENIMKRFALCLLPFFFTSPALAMTTPIFAAECAGGVNAGGFNIDTDGTGGLYIDGKKTKLKLVNEDYWVGGDKTWSIDIMSDEMGLTVSYTGKHGVNGMCVIVSE